MIDEEHVDVILGPSNTPNSLAVLDVASTSGTPFLSLSGSNILIDPQEGPKKWAFKMFPSEKLSIAQMLEHMKAKGIATLAMIGFSNALGDSFMGTMRNLAASYGVTIPVETRYNPADTSVAAQVLRMISTKPGAVFVVGSSVPATTPIIELRNRGYTGDIYTIMGIAGPDAMRVGGKALDGVLLSGVAVLAAEQLADTNPIKPAAQSFISAYEAKYGPGSRNLFGATLWDAFFLVDAASKPALSAARPGTPAFRTALRDAMEQVKGMAGAQGLFSLSPTDHSGAEPASQVMIEIRGGGYHLIK
jgi:branched-chain amino acid transport system substrate-binding protein